MHDTGLAFIYSTALSEERQGYTQLVNEAGVSLELLNSAGCKGRGPRLVLNNPNTITGELLRTFERNNVFSSLAENSGAQY